MKRLAAILTLAIGVVAIGHPASNTTAHAQATALYFVEIVNLVPRQHFTPMLVATHNASAAIFNLGMPASPELGTLAESGDVAPLMALLNTSANVMDVQTAAGLHGPGGTTSATVIGGAGFDRVSVAAMLIPTNDAFVALDTTLPAPGEMKVVYANAYDAGTETNDELCASIPGPSYPECGGPGTGGAPGNGEGAIVIHSGMRGHGDFGTDRDWKDPVAQIRIWQVG